MNSASRSTGGRSRWISGAILDPRGSAHEGKVVENERALDRPVGEGEIRISRREAVRIDARQDYPGSGEDVGFADPGNRDAVGEGAVGGFVGRGRPRRAASEDSRGLPGTRGGLRGGSWSRAEQARSTPEFDVILGPIESADS
jgi:hypothetical protein